MRGVLLAAVVLCALAAASPAQAKKVTADPNVSRAPVSQAQGRPDPRLARKITYQGGYKRLHTVAEELTKQTGVTIRAGDNKQDWRVRDIPVIVCVKDMPLGKLLQVIAGCGHVQLMRETIAAEKDAKSTYRFYRSKTKQDDIQGQLDARAEANKKLAAWAWDTLVAYSIMPDASADIPTSEGAFSKIDGTQVRLVADLLASLGADVRAKALSGEQVSVQIGADPSSPALNAIYKYALAQPYYYSKERRVQEPTEAERGTSFVAMKIHRRESPAHDAGFGFSVHGVPITFTDSNGHEVRYTGEWETSPVALVQSLADVKKLNIAPPPDSCSILEAEDAYPDAKFRRLKFYDLLLLRQKADLASLPVDKYGNQTLGAMLTKLSKDACLNIIAEDFNTAIERGRPTYRVAGILEATVGGLLKDLTTWSHSWFLDADDNVLVGWASDWHKHHAALVPESLVEGIHAKLEGEGAEIDDVVPLVDLTLVQLQEWFGNTHDFPGGAMSLISDKAGFAVWRLYSALSPEDRQLVKSEAGLALAKFDPEWISQFLAHAEKGIGDVGDQTSSPSQTAAERVLRDPEQISRFIMTWQTLPLRSWPIGVPEGATVYTDEFVPGPAGPKKHNYAIGLELSRDDAMRSPPSERIGVRDFPLFRLAFPVFTVEREAELRKKAESNAAGKK